MLSWVADTIQIIKNNYSCRQRGKSDLTFLHQFLPGMDCFDEE